MKKHLMVFCINLLVIGLHAQAQDEGQKNLFSKNALQSWELVVAPEGNWASIFDNNVFFGQISAGISINQRWFVGAYLGQSIEEIRPSSSISNLPAEEEVDFYQYGMQLAYTFSPNKLLHVSIPLHLGVFQTEVHEANRFNYDDDWDYDHYAFAVEPGLNLELNLLNPLRFYAGMRYRWLAADIYREEGISRPSNHLLVQAGMRIALLSRPKN
ncbi:MAG: hypothetical protein NWS63_00095 [Saprospiraceae bacterium]|jgi:hypothetical protein|nr:hypothetical protein [Saprospiraceae bacterium]MDP4998144.1 hypothetical protein [Saprospiraceae bacterium]